MHQAAEEIGRPELQSLLADSSRPLPLFEVWRLTPAAVAQSGVPTRPIDPQLPPWPQFAELLLLRSSWAYPGTAAKRRAFVSLGPARQANARATGSASGTPGTGPHGQLRPSCVPKDGLTSRPLCSTSSTPRHGAAACSTPRSRHSIVAWAVLSRAASAIAANPSGSFIPKLVKLKVR